MTSQQIGSSLISRVLRPQRPAAIRVVPDPLPEIDETLVQNIAKGRRWLAMVIDGTSFFGISDSENVSTRRVQDIPGLALIAPDILDAITLCEQPSNLSKGYLIETCFSAVWSERRAQFYAL